MICFIGAKIWHRLFWGWGGPHEKKTPQGQVDMEMCVRKGMELAMKRSFPSPFLFASSVTGKVIQAVFIA